MNSPLSVNPPAPVAGFAATVGLDWADQKHDVWLQPSQSGSPEHQIIEQKPEAIHAWIAQLRARFPEGKIALAVETSRGAIISALHAHDFIVIYPINPKLLYSYRQSFCVSGAKDDRTDAMLLEEYVRLFHSKLRGLQPDTELTRKLALLVENRRDLVNQRTALVNQIHSLVKTYFPLVEALFADFTLPMVADFLVKWPELALLQKTAPAAWRAFFYGHHSRGADLMQKRLDAIANARALTTDRALIEPSAFQVKTLAALLQVLHKAIAQIDAQIKSAMDQHPDAALFRSLPGAGPAMAPRLLVAFGTDRERFQSAQELQQFYGIAPVRKQSGNSCLIHMRYRCPKFGRQTFHENAALAKTPEAWAQEFYRQQRQRGKGHHAAIRTLAFKLIRIYFRCWKERTPFEAAKYQKALLSHGTTLIPKQSNPL